MVVRLVVVLVLVFLVIVFKAFGRALRMALTLDPRASGVVPSTKGSL